MSDQQLMGIDLTGRDEQEWLRHEAPPLKNSDLISSEDLLEGVKRELQPHVATELAESHLSPDVRDNFKFLREPDYGSIARIVLESASEETIEEVIDEAKDRISDGEVTPREYADLYISEAVEIVFERVEGIHLRQLGRVVAKRRENELKMRLQERSQSVREDELSTGASAREPTEQRQTHSGLSWVDEELPKLKKKLIA